MTPPSGQKEAFSRVVIDAQLKDVGWDLTDGHSVRYEYQLPDGTLADYVLCDRHGRAAAVIEAKRASVNLQEAAAQGRAYAEQLHDVPYVFLANGDEILFWDCRTEAYPRKVASFFSQVDLERRYAKRQVRVDIRSERKDATTRLRFVQKDSGIEESLPDASGEIRHGTHALTFEGSIFGGMIMIAYTAVLAGATNEGRITLSPTLDSWQGRHVTRLPYLDSLHAFLDRLESGWILEGSLMVEGLKLFSFDLNQLNEGEDGMAEYLRYVQSAGCVAGYLKVPIKFDRDYLPTDVEFRQVIEAAAIVRNQLTYSREEITWPIVSPLIVDEGASNLEVLAATKEPSVVKFVENEGQQITCMGETLQMPPRETVFLNILPKVLEREGDTKPGDTVEVEWVPMHGFRTLVTYIQPERQQV